MKISHPNAAPFFLEGGEHAVLMTHGFTGTPAHMRPLADRLHQAGFTVQGLLLPGHGTSIEDMAKSTWEQWLEAELQAVHQLQERYKYVSVCGLSMGGVLSLIAAEQKDVTCCIPISAPMKVKFPLISLAKPASYLIPQMKWGPGSAVKNQRLMEEYNIGYAGYPTAKAHDLNILMKLARKNLYAVSCPVLAVQSHDDRTISSDSAKIILQGVRHDKKDALWLRGVPHVCTISAEAEHIAACMTDALRKAQND